MEFKQICCIILCLISIILHIIMYCLKLKLLNNKNLNILNNIKVNTLQEIYNWIDSYITPSVGTLKFVFLYQDFYYLIWLIFMFITLLILKYPFIPHGRIIFFTFVIYYCLNYTYILFLSTKHIYLSLFILVCVFILNLCQIIVFCTKTEISIFNSKVICIFNILF